MIGAYQFVAPYVKRRSLLRHYSMNYYLDDTNSTGTGTVQYDTSFFQKTYRRTVQNN